MKHRKLRVAWSVAWGLLALMLLIWWVRSYWWSDSLGRGAYRMASAQGVVQFSNQLMPGDPGSFWTSNAFDDSPYVLPKFRYHSDFSKRYINAPHWLYIMLLSATSAAGWLRLKRFSLRSLLIAMTIVAVLLGLLVMMLRGR
jgi:hypothetical protein